MLFSLVSPKGYTQTNKPAKEALLTGVKYKNTKANSMVKRKNSYTDSLTGNTDFSAVTGKEMERILIRASTTYLLNDSPTTDKTHEVKKRMLALDTTSPPPHELKKVRKEGRKQKKRKEKVNG